MIFWAVAGSILTRRRYLARDLDTSNANFIGAMAGASLGPVGVAALWTATPKASNRLIVGLGLLTVLLVAVTFSFADPENICVVSGGFVASQVVNGLIIGIIYGFMALGLSLIFSALPDLSALGMARGRRSVLDQDARREHAAFRAGLDLQPAVHRGADLCARAHRPDVPDAPHMDR